MATNTAGRAERSGDAADREDADAQAALNAARRGLRAMAELLASDDPEASEPETFDAYDAACDRFWDAKARAERFT